MTLSSGASGETVTATCTGKSTKTAVTDSNGVATFKNLDMGYDWTFTWSTFSATEYIGDLTVSVTLGAIDVRIYASPQGGMDLCEYDTDSGTVGNIIATATWKSGWQNLGLFPLVPNKTYFVGGKGHDLRIDIRPNSESAPGIGQYISTKPGYTISKIFTMASDISSLYISTDD